jgi:hypothetical protein
MQRNIESQSVCECSEQPPDSKSGEKKNLMFAKRKIPSLERLVRLPCKHLPFLHQLQSQSLCLLQTNREILHPLKNLILQLPRERRYRIAAISLSYHDLAPPIHALARNIRSRDDTQIWIHQEKRKDLPVPWPRRIRQLKWLNLMLQNVGPG